MFPFESQKYRTTLMLLSEVTVEDVLRMQEGLCRFLDEMKAYLQFFSFSPATETSLASEEVSAVNDVLLESLRTSWSVCSFLIENVAEHASAFAELTTNPVKMLASATCVRSMLESGSRITWIFAPQIDTRERMGRTIALRYEGLVEKSKTVRLINNHSELTSITKQIDNFVTKALRNGFEQELDKKGRRIWIGAKYPSATELIKSMLDDELMYRVLSAVVHGHHSAIIEFGFTPSPEENFNDRGNTFFAFTKGPNNFFLLCLGLSVLNAMTRPLWNACRYFGWNELALTEIFENAADRMLVSDKRRFWRTPLPPTS